MNNHQKGLSSIFVIGLVILVLVIVGSIGYFLLNKNKQDNLSKQQNQSQDNFSKLNKDELLDKLFPSLSFKDGKANFSSDGDNEMYLSNSIEDYFINNQEKDLLLIAQYEGKYHAVGFYHAFLGLFDKNGNLLTGVFPLQEKAQSNIPYKNEFLAFAGNFSFYDCKGIKYILSSTENCSTASCCNGTAVLFRVNNGDFENIQTINNGGGSDPSYNVSITLSGDKMVIKKVPLLADNNKCPEADFKELIWNKNSCKFE